jgi:hypothetical protein
MQHVKGEEIKEISVFYVFIKERISVEAPPNPLK